MKSYDVHANFNATKELTFAQVRLLRAVGEVIRETLGLELAVLTVYEAEEKKNLFADTPEKPSIFDKLNSQKSDVDMFGDTSGSY